MRCSPRQPEGHLPLFVTFLRFVSLTAHYWHMPAPPNPLLAALVVELRNNPQATDDALATRLAVPATVVRTIRATDMFKMVLANARSYSRNP